MFCSVCGTENPGTASFCNHCGRPLTEEATASGPVMAPTAPKASVYKGPQENSGKAIASLVCGIFALVLNLLLVPGILAVVLGHTALSQINSSAGRLKGEGMALGGLIMGYLSFAAIPVFLIIAAIAIPGLLRSRIAANESSAVGSVRTINTVEYTYSSTYPKVGFTCALKDLDGMGPQYSEKSAGLIDSVLAGGQKSGYRFALRDCSGSPVESYRVTAEPTERNKTGRRAFCSDQTGVIRYTPQGTAEACLSSGIPLD